MRKCRRSRLSCATANVGSESGSHAANRRRIYVVPSQLGERKLEGETNDRRYSSDDSFVQSHLFILIGVCPEQLVKVVHEATQRIRRADFLCRCSHHVAHFLFPHLNTLDHHHDPLDAFHRSRLLLNHACDSSLLRRDVGLSFGDALSFSSESG